MKATLIRLLRAMPLDPAYDGFVERAENWAWWIETADRQTIAAERQRVWTKTPELRRILNSPARSRGDQIVQAITRIILGWLITPPRGDEPRKERSDRTVDLRSLIRESRAFESTTGPPRSVINETGPRAGYSMGPISLVAMEGKSTATFSRIAEISKPDFSGTENCARKPGAELAMRDLEEGVADDTTSHKTRH